MMRQKNVVLSILAAAVLTARLSPAWGAGAPNVLTAQGLLQESGVPVNAARDFDFRLCTAPGGGTCFASGVQTVNVSNGLYRAAFTVPGGSDLNLGPWYLETQVGPVSGALTALTPREQLTSSPYAVSAMSLHNGAKVGTAPNPAGALNVGGSISLAPGGKYLMGDGGGGAGEWIQELNLGVAPYGMAFYTNSSEKMRIDLGGNVGIGTTGPAVKLQVSVSGAVGTATFENTSANPASIELKSNTGGDQPNGISFNSYSPGQSGIRNKAIIETVPGGHLRILTSNDGNLAGAERMRIQAAGNIGIGTTNPDNMLTVNGSVDKPGGGSWGTFSDSRLKNIAGGFQDGLKQVMKLQPIRYRYKADNALDIHDQGEHIGFSAQEVEKIIPEAITKNSRGYRILNNDPILWAMLNAIKEQQRMIASQQKEIEEIRARIKAGTK